MLSYKVRSKLLEEAIQKGSAGLRAWYLECDSESFRVHHFGALIGGYDYKKQEFFSTHVGWSRTDCDNLREFLSEFNELDKRTPSLLNVAMYHSNGMFSLPFMLFGSEGDDGLYYVDGVFGFQFPRPESYVLLSCPQMTIAEIKLWGGRSYYPNKKENGQAYFPQSVLRNPDFIKRVLILQVNHYKNYDVDLYNYLKPEDKDKVFQTYMDLNSLKYGWEVRPA